MKLEYEITKQDYIDFNIYHMNHSIIMKRSLFIQRFFIPIIFLILPIFLVKITDIPLWYWFGVFIVTSVLWIIYYPKFFKKSVERNILKMLEEGKTTGIVGNHIFSYSEEGVVDKTEFSETSYNLIEKVVESEAHIFIYVSAVMAYIIPIKIFGSVDEKENFLNMLNKR